MKNYRGMIYQHGIYPDIMKQILFPMKNSLLLPVAILPLLFLSCSKDRSNHLYAPGMQDEKTAVVTNSSSEETSTTDYVISREMVDAYLQSELNQKREQYTISPYPSNDNPLLYIVNFEEGWKILPGDSRFGLVLAESSTGHIKPSVKSDNPGFNLWIEDYLNQIGAARDLVLEGSKADEGSQIWALFKAPGTMDNNEARWSANREQMWGKINFQTNTVIDTLGYKAPLLQTKWGQQNPWYVSMPTLNGNTCLTGCAAVAVSQVLYYFHSQQNMPTGLYGSVSIQGTTLHGGPGVDPYLSITVDRSNFTYNSSLWNNMPLDSVGVNPTGYKNVSDLMLDVGSRLQLHYRPSFTGIVTNYNNYYDTTPCKVSGIWESYSQAAVSSLVSSLNSNKPVIACAKLNDGSGHTWVIDGYYMAEITTTNTYEWWPVNMIPPGTAIYGYKGVTELLAEYNNSIYPGILDISETSYSSNLLHMNWGNNGREDGYATFGSPYNNWQGFTNNIAIQVYLSPSEFTQN